MELEEKIRIKYQSLGLMLNEKTRRIWAATEALALGYGGTSLVSRATGISRRAILVGSKEVERGDAPEPGRIRRAGGGMSGVILFPLQGHGNSPGGYTHLYNTLVGSRQAADSEV